MNARHATLVSVLVGLIAVAGGYAAAHTVQLGVASQTANRSSAVSVAKRQVQLDRFAASLQRELKRRPPKLPRLPHFAPVAPAAPVVSAPAAAAPAPQRVVYVRPAPHIIHLHRHGEPGDGPAGGDGGGGDG
jgi:hypothetical protein